MSDSTVALLIDDNSLNLKVLKQMLVKQGITCIEVSDPTTLQTILSDLEQVDLVFLDLEMPGFDGYSAKNLLRDTLGDTPIIAYTVHTSELSTVRQAGFDGMLGKPLNSTRFPDQLSRILSGQSVWNR
jgi:CheY-like chemotaxis protein